MNHMKTLTVQQPWAWAIIHGPKRIENRSRATRHRGPLLIHAGKSRARLGSLGAVEPPPGNLAFGALIGIVDLVDCVPVADVADQPFAEGPWCWILANPRPVIPVFLRGQLGLFDTPVVILQMENPEATAANRLGVRLAR